MTAEKLLADVARLARALERNPSLRASILDSPTHRRNIPNLCARCHKAGAPAAVRHPEGDVAKVERQRVGEIRLG